MGTGLDAWIKADTTMNEPYLNPDTSDTGLSGRQCWVMGVKYTTRPCPCALRFGVRTFGSGESAGAVLSPVTSESDATRAGTAHGARGSADGDGS